MNFRPILIGLLAAAISACAVKGVPRSAIFESGTACIDQYPVVDGSERTIYWCIAAKLFEPRKYKVSIDGEVIFDGTDFSRVEFRTTSKLGVVHGHCDEFVQIVEFGSGRRFPISKLPESLVAKCRIESGLNGVASPFLNQGACAQQLTVEMSKLSGVAVPTEESRTCKIYRGDLELFDGTFVAR